MGKILEVVMKLKVIEPFSNHDDKRERAEIMKRKNCRELQGLRKKPASKREKGLKKSEREEFYALSVSFLRHHYMSHTQRTFSLS